MILWRSLTKEEFEVRITCSRAGEMRHSELLDLRSDYSEVKGEGKGADEYGDGGGQMHGDDSMEECKVEENENDRKLKARELGVEEIRKGMERMLFRLVAKGWANLLFGLSLNVGWLMAAMQAQRSVSYNPA